MKTIKQVSKFSGASVRTLQYYDNIHLLTPSRTKSSYRLYSDEDITKLRQILFLKELGFSLKEIRSIINHPNVNQSAIFRQQKELLHAKRQRTGQIIQILERLEDGATLDDCAKAIESISKEPKTMQKSIKLILFIVPLLIAGAVGTYFLVHGRQASTYPEPGPSEDIVADVINLNPAAPDDGLKCYDLDIRLLDATALPANSPAIADIAFPDDLVDNVEIQGLYARDDSAEYNRLVNYEISSGTSGRYVRIGFIADRTPIREMYAPEGEPSILNGHELMIAHHAGEYYNKALDALEPSECYYADFTHNGLNYSVETRGLSEPEVITLLKSLL